jgi:hypothetical protein
MLTQALAMHCFVNREVGQVDRGEGDVVLKIIALAALGV